MMRRYLVAILVLPLFLVAAAGCGDSSGSDSPKVENPTVKMKAVTPSRAKPGDEGASMHAD